MKHGVDKAWSVEGSIAVRVALAAHTIEVVHVWKVKLQE